MEPVSYSPTILVWYTRQVIEKPRAGRPQTERKARLPTVAEIKIKSADEPGELPPKPVAPPGRSHLRIAPAIRTGEHLDEMNGREHLTKPEGWQRAQAWATAQDLLRKDIPEATLEELRRAQEAALARAVRSRGYRR